MTSQRNHERQLVLHIDDNEGDLELVRLAIDDCCGPMVECCSINDGQEALRLLAGFAQPGERPIALILLDLNIPRLSGWDIIAFIQMDPYLRTVPLVALSGSKSPRDTTLARQAGVSSRTKPTTYTALSRLIGEILVTERIPSPPRGADDPFLN